MEAEINEGYTLIHYSNIDGVETSTIITTNDENLNEIVQRFREFLLACGFQPKSVDEYIELN